MTPKPPFPASPGIFRQDALDHYLEVEEKRTLVRISPPWTWSLLGILLAAISTGLVASFMGKVEVIGRGRGILHPETGIRMLVCQVEGTVGAVEAHSGQRVKEGTILLRLDAPQVLARLHEARRAREAIRRDLHGASLRQDAAYRQQCENLQGRIARLCEHIASQERSVGSFTRKLETFTLLQEEGIQSSAQVEEVRETLAQAQRALNLSFQDLERARQESASLEHQHQDGIWQRQQTIQGAEAQEESLAYLQSQTVVRAPGDGVIEALLVKPGDVVNPGRPLGKLVPMDVPLRVICFLPEKDRAFVKPGDAAVLELAQLPYAEYGILPARVLRVSEDLASPHELQEALGEGHLPGDPAFRVELEITDPGPAKRAKVPLRSGMLLNVRFTLRRQRFITLVLDPLRKWVG